MASLHDLILAFPTPSLAETANLPEVPPNLPDMLAPAVAYILNPSLTVAE